MFNKNSKDGYSTPLEGIEMKTLVHGEKKDSDGRVQATER